MPEYRAYFVSHDDHFIGCEVLVCPDDSDATEKAKSLANGQDVEVWSGPRLVAKLRAATVEQRRPLIRIR